MGQEQLESLLSDTVMLLCKNALKFHVRLKVEGLIGVTVDGNIFLVRLNNELLGETLLAQKSQNNSTPFFTKHNRTLTSCESETSKSFISPMGRNFPRADNVYQEKQRQGNNNCDWGNTRIKPDTPECLASNENCQKEIIESNKGAISESRHGVSLSGSGMSTFHNGSDSEAERVKAPPLPVCVKEELNDEAFESSSYTDTTSRDGMQQMTKTASSGLSQPSSVPNFSQRLEFGGRFMPRPDFKESYNKYAYMRDSRLPLVPFVGGDQSPPDSSQHSLPERTNTDADEEYKPGNDHWSPFTLGPRKRKRFSFKEDNGTKREFSWQGSDSQPRSVDGSNSFIPTHSLNICDYPMCGKAFQHKHHLLRHQTRKHGRTPLRNRTRYDPVSGMYYNASWTSQPSGLYDTDCGDGFDMSKDEVDRYYDDMPSTSRDEGGVEGGESGNDEAVPDDTNNINHSEASSAGAV